MKQQSRVKMLRDALAPFAKAFENVRAEDVEAFGKALDEMKLQQVLFRTEQPTIGDLRKAAEVLKETAG